MRIIRTAGVGAMWVTLCTGCGSSAPTPQPTPPPTRQPPATPSNVITIVAVGTATATVQWNAAPGATSYVAEIGSAPGAVDAAHQTTGTSDSFTGLAFGRYFLRVKAANAAGQSAPSNDVVAVIIDPALADYIEALFLGSGPLVPRDGMMACVTPGRWARWAQGATAHVRVSSTATVAMQDPARRMIEQIRGATLGAVDATFEVTGESDPLPQPGEVTEALHPDPLSTGCGTWWGCVHITFQGAVIATGRAVLDKIVPARAWAHELGHAILGMCHIDGALIGGARNSMMSGGPGVTSLDISDGPTARDLQATQAVYFTALAPLASRDDFVRAGLVKGTPALLAVRPPVEPPGARIIHEPFVR